MKRAVVFSATAVAAGLLGLGFAVPAHAVDPSCAHLIDAPLTRTVVAGSSAAVQDLWSTPDPTADGAAKAGHLTPGSSYQASDPAPSCTKAWTTSFIAVGVNGERRSVSAAVVYETPDPATLRFDSVVKPSAIFGTKVYKAPSAEAERATPATLDAPAEATSAQYAGKPYLGGSGQYRAVKLPDGKVAFVDQQDVIAATRAELDAKATAKPGAESTSVPKASESPVKRTEEKVEADVKPGRKAAMHKVREASTTPSWLEAPGGFWIGAVGGAVLGFVAGLSRLVSVKRRH